MSDGQIKASQIVDYTEVLQETIDRGCSGLISGGEISISATPGKIDVAQGIGIVVDHVSIGQRVIFPAAPAQSPEGNGTNYIHIKPDGTVEISAIKAVTDRIYLGHAFVSAGVVIDVFPVPEWAGHFGARINEFVAHALKVMVAEGMTVSEDGGNPLELRVADGEFYARLSEYEFDETALFTKLFNSSDLGWQPDLNTPNHANTSQWNDVTRPNATALQDLTAGWYKKDMLVAAPSGKVYYLFAQSQWATEDEAILAAFPVLPYRVSQDLIPLAGFVIKQGDASIAAGLIDIRPNLERIFGFGSGASATTLDHGTLAGLADDDHPQYQLVSGKSAALGYPSLDAATLIPIAEIPTGNTASKVCLGNDARLSDPRTPVAHVHAPAEVTGTAVIESRTINGHPLSANVTVTLADVGAEAANANIQAHVAGTGSPHTAAGVGAAATVHSHAPADITGTAVITTDPRLSDARLPLNFLDSSSEGDTTRTSASYTDKVTLATGALTGRFLIECYAELTVNNPTARFQVKFLNTSDVVDYCALETNVSASGVWHGFSGFYVLALSGVSKTLAIQFASQDGTRTVTIRRARITMRRVS